MIIGLIGHRQVGKDSVARILVNDYGFTRLAFADALKDALYDLNPALPNGLQTFVDTTNVRGSIRLAELVDRWGWDNVKEAPEVRRLLQAFGESVRSYARPDAWIKPVADRILLNRSADYVITDVRHLNELAFISDAVDAAYVNDQHGEVWRITRPTGIEDGHVTETVLDHVNPQRDPNLFRSVTYRGIHNDRDLTGLGQDVRHLLRAAQTVSL